MTSQQASATNQQAVAEEVYQNEAGEIRTALSMNNLIWQKRRGKYARPHQENCGLCEVALGLHSIRRDTDGTCDHPQQSAENDTLQNPYGFVNHACDS